MQRAPVPLDAWRLSRRQLLVLLGGGALAPLASCTPPPESAPSAPLDDPSIPFASLTEVARLIEDGQISPIELTRLMLDRIENLDARLMSYATVMGEQALAAAEAAEREIQNGSYRGPLHGIPVAVKDLCYTRGVPTMGGLAVLSELVPEYDATVVSRLEEAGAVLLGKLNTTEGAMAGYHPDFEVPVNPWGEELWAGASSSGSGVATASGLCYASLGSDTGGSIRFPSMANGIVGLKPTYGRVSRYGVLALAESLDHVGPMTRRTADAAIVLEAIAGYDPNDPTSLRDPVPNMLDELSRGVDGVRVGFDRGYATEGTDPGLAASIDEALAVLESLGAQVVDVEMPAVTPELQQAWFTICSSEAHAAHEANYPSRAEEYGAYFADFLALGAEVSEADYASSTEMREEFNGRFLEALSQVDAVASPSGGVPFVIPRRTHYENMAAFDAFMPQVQMQHTIPADFAGTPTLSLPCGFSDEGLPHTIQLMGRRLSEAMLCRIGHAYEGATSWHERHPEL